jgi:hypothetical protein
MENSTDEVKGRSLKNLVRALANPMICQETSAYKSKTNLNLHYIERGGFQRFNRVVTTCDLPLPIRGI